MPSNLLHSNLARQLLGGVIGMLGAGVLYVTLNQLPSAQIGKALLLGSPSTSVTSEISVTSSVSSIEPSTDRTDWLAMRAAQRSRGDIYDVSAPHAGAAAQTVTTQTSIAEAPLTDTRSAPSLVPETPATHLPDSGPGSVLMILVTLFLSFTLLPAPQRQRLFAVMKAAD